MRGVDVAVLRRRLVVATLASLVLAGCGSKATPPTGSPPDRPGFDAAGVPSARPSLDTDLGGPPVSTTCGGPEDTCRSEMPDGTRWTCPGSGNRMVGNVVRDELCTRGPSPTPVRDAKP